MLSRKKNEAVVIVCGGTQIEVMVAEIRGDKVRLRYYRAVGSAGPSA